MCPGVAVLAGGGGAGGGSGKGSKKGKGKKKGKTKKGKGNASGNKKKGGCASGDPICPISGRVFLELYDFGFAGPLPLRWERSYSSRISNRATELGFGWTHSFGWRLEVSRRAIVVVDDRGLEQPFEPPPPGEATRNDLGWTLTVDGDGWCLRTGESDRIFHFGPAQHGVAHLRAQRDVRGNSITLTRDERGALQGLVDSAGRRYRVETDSLGRIVAVAVALDPQCQSWLEVVRYRYDEHGDLVSATDAEEFTFRYAYANHLLVEHASPTGLVVRYAYDGDTHEAWGVRTWAELPSDDVPLIDWRRAAPETQEHRAVMFRSLLFDKPANYCESVNGRGEALRFFGDDQGRVVKYVDRVGGVTSYQYDPTTGAKTVEIAPDGTARNVSADANGAPAGFADADGVVDQWADEDGVETTADSRLGSITRRVHDRFGDLVFIEHADGTREEYEYDERGCLLAHVDRKGRTTRYVHDEMGNCVEIWSPLGMERYQYDYLGRTIAHTDPIGRVTRWTWDRRNEPIRKTYPDGTCVEVEWDADRNPILKRDAGRVTRFRWVGFGWLAATEFPSGVTWEQRYDVEGQLVAIRNGRGRELVLERDAEGRCVRHRTFEGVEWTTSFDVGGRPTLLSGPLGAVTLEYDAAGRLVALESSDVSIAIEQGPERPVSMDNGTTKVEWEIDPLGRVVMERQGNYENQVDWSAGELLRVVSNVGPPARFFGEAGRGCRIGSRSLTRGLSDTAWPLRSWDVLGEHLLLRKTMNECGYVTEQVLFRKGAAEPLMVRRFLYNDANALVACDYGGGERVELTLDSGDRAVRRTHFRGDVVARDERFSFDAAGSLLSPGVRLDDVGRPVDVGGDTLHYDEIGRLVRRERPGGDDFYLWNSLDQLVAVERPDRRVTFEYDALGRRMRKRVLVGDQEVSAIDYVWCNDLLFREIDRVSGRVRTYFLDHNRWETFGHVDVVGGPRGTQRAVFYLLDPNGAVESAVDEDGREVYRARLGLYGEGVPELDEAGITARFVGQHWDEDVGLSYNRFRWYDPSCGRYLSPDPLLLAGNLNPRDYVENPTRFCDPLGAHPGIGPAAGSATGGPNNAGYHPSPENPVASRPNPFVTTGPTTAPARQETARYLARPGHWANNTPPPPDTPAGRTPGYANCPASALHDGDGFGDYRDPNSAQAIVDRAGNTYGCHSCGARHPGQTNPDGTPHWTCDHQPPRSTYSARNATRSGNARSNRNANRSARPGGESEAVRLYPHCVNCSNAQMRTTSGQSNTTALRGPAVAAGNRQMTQREAQIRQQRAAEERASRRGQWDWEID